VRWPAAIIVKKPCLTCAVKLPPAVSYSLARIAVFAVTLVVLLLALPRLNLLVVAAIAALVSGVLSYYLLAGPREAMARSVEGRVHGLRGRMDRAAAKEDAALDAQERRDVEDNGRPPPTAG
jgi:hypothetical protein